MTSESNRQSKKGAPPPPRQLWDEKETHVLIDIWEDRLCDLRRQKRNGNIYEEMTESLRTAGSERSQAQVHNKIENLSPDVPLVSNMETGDYDASGVVEEDAASASAVCSPVFGNEESQHDTAAGPPAPPPEEDTAAGSGVGGGILRRRAAAKRKRAAASLNEFRDSF
ncbi:hypothetical protein HPB48_023652 [Haemaphysalis longicornis]|uniref:Myb/SANT-like DNA-binding domain-containing protein n=1 Tax=Haemaphysalis longicornis TaxID=44386 RepID=A0A9J6H5K0_HAELO|nr:hypothetical protein HPB48_023652 [Haemaphysalis longicornis]